MLLLCQGSHSTDSIKSHTLRYRIHGFPGLTLSASPRPWIESCPGEGVLPLDGDLVSSWSWGAALCSWRHHRSQGCFGILQGSGSAQQLCKVPSPLILLESTSPGQSRSPEGASSCLGSLQPPQSPSHPLFPPAVPMCDLKRVEVAERRKTGHG